MFQVKYKMFMLDLPDDVQFGTAETFPLCHDNSNMHHHASLPKDHSNNPLDRTNGNSIIEAMVSRTNGLACTGLNPKTRGLLQQRCWIVSLDNAIGRCGEI